VLLDACPAAIAAEVTASPERKSLRFMEPHFRVKGNAEGYHFLSFRAKRGIPIATTMRYPDKQTAGYDHGFAPHGIQQPLTRRTIFLAIGTSRFARGFGKPTPPSSSLPCSGLHGT
jgi:hypothetical protein